jgi:hypothetical protein
VQKQIMLDRAKALYEQALLRAFDMQVRSELRMEIRQGLFR